MTYGCEDQKAFTPNYPSVLARTAIASARTNVATGESLDDQLRCRSSEAISARRLLSNKILTAMSDEDFASLLPHLEPVSLTCGEDVCESGEPAKFVYFPETTVISHIHILQDGGTIEAAMIGREGMTGIATVFGQQQPSYWTQVTISGNALRVRMDVIKSEFAHRRGLQRLLLGCAGACLAQISQRAVCNNRHRVEERLSSWLLMMQDRVADEQLPLTHDQIARHLGVRRAGITNAVNALRDEQIITCGRARIRIIDRDALESAACECHALLREDFYHSPDSRHAWQG